MRMQVFFFSILSLVLFGACGFDDDKKRGATSPDEGGNGEEHVAEAFVSKWRVSTEGTIIKLPLPAGFNYDFVVDWGDGEVSEHSGAAAAHAYEKTGVYTVRVSGLVEAWNFAAIPHSRNMLLSVEELGDVGWRSFQGAFAGCDELTVVSGGNTSGVYTMHAMFEGADLVVPDTSEWDTHQVKSMTAMFMGTHAANPDVSNWDTAQVHSMHSMFRDTHAAQPEVSKWDTGNVTDMSYMFMNAIAAAPEVSNWNTGNVTNMSSIFRGAVAANPDVGDWDVSSVTKMNFMFAEAVSANPNVSKWDTSAATSMRGMFTRATSANPVVNNWDTSAVTNMAGMFLDAISAEPSLNCWDVSKVADMRHMFGGAVKADVNLSKWDFSSAIFMHGMFSGTTLSLRNYDGLLNRLLETSARSNLILDAGNSQYSVLGAKAHQSLTDKGWYISDAGMEEVIAPPTPNPDGEGTTDGSDTPQDPTPPSGGDTNTPEEPSNPSDNEGN